MDSHDNLDTSGTGGNCPFCYYLRRTEQWNQMCAEYSQRSAEEGDEPSHATIALAQAIGEVQAELISIGVAFAHNAHASYAKAEQALFN